MADPSTRHDVMPGAERPVREPSRASGVAFAVVLVAWIVVTGVVLVAFAVQRTGMEVACPPHPAYSSYGDAHWGWWPPGISCTYTTRSGVVTHPPTHPSSWSLLVDALPLGLGIAAARPADGRCGGSRAPESSWASGGRTRGRTARSGTVTCPAPRSNRCRSC